MFPRRPVQMLVTASRRLNDWPRLGKNHSTREYALCPWQVVRSNATTVAGSSTPPHATHHPGHTQIAFPCPTAREPPQLLHFTSVTKLVASPPKSARPCFPCPNPLPFGWNLTPSVGADRACTAEADRRTIAVATPIPRATRLRIPCSSDRRHAVRPGQPAPAIAEVEHALQAQDPPEDGQRGGVRRVHPVVAEPAGAERARLRVRRVRGVM